MTNKYINSWPFFLKFHHRHNWTLQFQCAGCSNNEEDKEELIKLEVITINVSDSSGYGGVTRVYSMRI